MRVKKQPIRRCTGCGESKPKRELVRVVRSPEGEISIDKTGKKNGRGAYICPNPECLKKAKKAKRLDRSFEMQVPDEIYEQLEKELSTDGDAQQG
ncbi:MAG: YlxR family protein [Clostridiales bacterium]|nr:YlxR family protein [Clostridiales bacterium]HOA34556.1 YlxR family protein [Clostridiales bacterium]HOJ35490.1 YlxR family protein [Clostridiales bacterium]HOL79356.1 YlxR family protein [Clostridiales bacterium]HPP67859.1 YlxR family protein [Clostridiales bacterium]